MSNGIFCLSSCLQVRRRCSDGVVFFLGCVECNGDVVVSDTKQTFAAAEAGDLPDFLFREVENILDEPGLLLLHLHDDFDAAGVQNALAIFAIVQGEQVLHTLGGQSLDLTEHMSLLQFPKERQLKVQPLTVLFMTVLTPKEAKHL